MLAWDTGASAGCTPFRADFVDYQPVEMEIQGVETKSNVVGIGITLHKFIDQDKNPCFLPCLSYHVPNADIRLFSPQTFHQYYGGHSVLNGDSVVMHLESGRQIRFNINQKDSNIPIAFNTSCSQPEK